MKYLKSMMLAIFFSATLTIHANGMRLTIEERALVMTFRMSKYLQLTEAQKAEVMKVNQNALEKMEIAKQQFCNQKEMLKKSRKEIFETRDAELQKIFTKEQFEIFQKKQQEIRAAHKKEMEARRAANPNRSNQKPSDPVPQPSDPPTKK